MTDARKAELSRKGKERWAQAKQLAELLDVDVDRVYSSIGRIRRAGHLRQALGGDEAALKECRPLLEKERVPPLRIHRPAKTPVEDKLKIAMWFIRKMGSAEEAVRVIQAAAEAVEKLK